jgi:hypothetical protein
MILFMAVALAGPVTAQSYPSIGAPGSLVPLSGQAFTDGAGKTRGVTPSTPLPVAGKQESFALATANAAAPPSTLYGGTYMMTQGCTAYGQVALRYLAADGSTMTTMLTKTAAETGGTAVQFGTGAIVDVALSGTTGCNVTLARIP